MMQVDNSVSICHSNFLSETKSLIEAELEKLDEVSLNFLQENRIPASFVGGVKPIFHDQELLEKQSIRNLSVLSKNGTLYKGFLDEMMSYEEAEMLCLSRGAKLPWFEMMPDQFLNPVWVL